MRSNLAEEQAAPIEGRADVAPAPATEVRRCRKCQAIQTVRNVYRDRRGVMRCRPCRRAQKPLKKRVCAATYCGVTWSDASTSPYCPGCREKRLGENATRMGRTFGGGATRVCAGECGLRLPICEFRVEQPVAKGDKAYHDVCEDCRLGDNVALPGSPGWHATQVVLAITGLRLSQYSRSAAHPGNLLWFALACRWGGVERSHSCWGDVELGIRLCEREGLLVQGVEHARTVIAERNHLLGWTGETTPRQQAVKDEAAA